jgi:probable HAF family extracellular repeat protein
MQLLRLSATFLICASFIASDSAAIAGRPAAAAHPFAIVDLGTLGGGSSTATAINDAGQVVGASETSTGSRHAFSWTQSSGMTDLGIPTGDPSIPPYASSAVAVNAAGQVAGTTVSGYLAVYPVLWTRAGGASVGPGGGRSSFVSALNDAGPGCRQ